MSMLLMCFLAVIGGMPLFLLVASLRRIPARDAQRQTMAFLEEWGGIAPEHLQTWMRQTIGGTIGFSLLLAVAFGFNFVGDTNITPAISKAFQHFGYAYTEWSDAYERDWERFRDSIKMHWVMEHPTEDLMNDPDAWDTWKNNRGKEQVRVPRTLVGFSVVLFIAGLVDVASPAFRRRGMVLTLIAALLFVLLMYIWADRKNHYVHAVVQANESLESSRPVPPSLELILR